MKLKDNTLLKTQALINGKWVGGEDLEVTNPATGDVLGKVPVFGEKEANEAVEAAKAAFPGWSKKLAKERSKIMRDWFNLIMENADDIAMIMTSEQGKPLAEAKGEVAYAASFIEFYAEEAKRVYGETIPTHKADARIIVQRQPVGVVSAITPWNFPAAMITRKVAPALAVGCTAVIKPAGETPLTALALGELAIRAGFPEGCINIITGKSSEIGKVLTGHEAIKAFSFTGSTEIGKLLMRQCADTVKKVGLELGGNAPFIVFDDADIEKAVEGAMISKFRNAGQTCVCANRIYVQAGVYDEFSEKLAKAVNGLKVGDGTGEGVTTGPLINEAAVEKVEEHIADAKSKGASVVTGGDRHQLGGTFFQPTVLRDVTKDMVVSRDETFGPVAPLFKFETEDEAIQRANDTEFGLAAYFYSRDVGRCFRVGEALEYGMIGINEGLISTEVAPFGGVKESGIGREGSSHGIDEYTELKYMLMGGL
ncbi:NAD-dependent succinate-semialdehyde dehydrogenase [Tepidamorphus sp. 3E244]|uniref:NAD-dependent succinate-semialdehyde dehydrogenase n=1 Tax=Tepidamorphus sp. 3E244 TaxID=3385498 RepID=UPI0038FD0779